MASGSGSMDKRLRLPDVPSNIVLARLTKLSLKLLLVGVSFWQHHFIPWSSTSVLEVEGYTNWDPRTNIVRPQSTWMCIRRSTGQWCATDMCASRE
eukprot:5396704-Amphidinium_carterae.1